MDSRTADQQRLFLPGLVRRLFQVGAVLASVWAGLRLAAGWSLDGVEKYCPFGGIETAWAFFTGGRFTCAAGALNLALFLALLALALLARKAFCGWVCPVGAIAEGLGLLGRRMLGRRGGSAPGSEAGPCCPSVRVDRALRWIRLPVLVLVLAATWKTGELIFRGWDPFYVLFSAHGHDVRWWSYPVLAVVLGLAFLIPVAWCRYLCPLGALLWPFSRVGRLRVGRIETVCTKCGSCDRACPHGLTVASVPSVSSGECTLCLACAGACPTPSALELRAAGVRSKVTFWVVPFLVVLCAAGGVLGARLLEAPSVVREYGAPRPSGELATVVFTVAGLKCTDTAQTFSSQFEGIPGVLKMEAFAAPHRARILYEPARTSPAVLREAAEAPVVNGETGAISFGVFRVVEVDGKPVP